MTTNEEKARVLSVKASCEAYYDEEAQKQYQTPSTETIARVNAYGACMEMAQWKDEQHEKEKQQWIELTVEWLQKNADNYAYIHVGCNESETYPYVKDKLLVEDFKKYAEEQL